MTQKSVIRNISAVAATTFILSGCANMPDMPEWTKSEALQGGALGAVACGVGAALFGGSKKEIAGAAAICGAIGAIGGKLLKDRREKYSSAEAMYAGEIEKAQLFNAEKELYKTQLVADISHIEAETQKLVSLQKRGKANQQALKNQRIVLKKKQEEVSKVVKNMKDELEFQKALHAEIKKEKPKDSRLANLEKEVNKLHQTIAEVEKQGSQLADLDYNLI